MGAAAALAWGAVAAGHMDGAEAERLAGEVAVALPVSGNKAAVKA